MKQLDLLPGKGPCGRETRLDSVGKPVACGSKGYVIVEGKTFCLKHFAEEKVSLEILLDELNRPKEKKRKKPKRR